MLFIAIYGSILTTFSILITHLKITDLRQLGELFMPQNELHLGHITRRHLSLTQKKELVKAVNNALATLNDEFKKNGLAPNLDMTTAFSALKIDDFTFNGEEGDSNVVRCVYYVKWMDSDARKPFKPIVAEAIIKALETTLAPMLPKGLHFTPRIGFDPLNGTDKQYYFGKKPTLCTGLPISSKASMFSRSGRLQLVDRALATGEEKISALRSNLRSML